MLVEAPDAPATPPIPDPPTPDPFDEFIGKSPKLGGDFGKLVERVFTVDVLPVYDRLEAALKVGENRNDYGTLRKALDDAESNAREAHQLYLAARAEQERYDLDMKPIRAAMMERANRELQREKADGTRNKAITKEDLELFCARNFADEFRDQEMRSIRLRKTTEHLERFAELWKGRCRTLDTMLTTLRK
jgi:hypothetical protein